MQIDKLCNLLQIIVSNTKKGLGVTSKIILLYSMWGMVVGARLKTNVKILPWPDYVSTDARLVLGWRPVQQSFYGQDSQTKLVLRQSGWHWVEDQCDNPSKAKTAKPCLHLEVEGSTTEDRWWGPEERESTTQRSRTTNNTPAKTYKRS
jgi:hypothetical protein